MPYHKNKMAAFEAAQNGMRKVTDVYVNLQAMKHDPEFGREVKRFWEEINEAYQQVENADEVASEHQREQLSEFRETLEQYVSELNEYNDLR